MENIKLLANAIILQAVKKITGIHIRRNAEQKSSVFSVPNGSVP